MYLLSELPDILLSLAICANSKTEDGNHCLEKL